MLHAEIELGIWASAGVSVDVAVCEDVVRVLLEVTKIKELSGEGKEMAEFVCVCRDRETEHMMQEEQWQQTQDCHLFCLYLLLCLCVHMHGN